MGTYPEGMSTPRPDQRDDTAVQLAAVGIHITPEGRARARAELDAAADARNTPEAQAARAELRARLGLPPAAAA